MSAADHPLSTAERIVEILSTSEDASSSGEALARRIGVSRAAVWKAISALRERGFAIDATSGHGYRLVSAPDRMTPGLVTPWLGTTRLGRRLLCLDETESTMDDAARCARGGDPEGTVVVAETQRAGRGRRGRVWHSPPGLNLYFSLLLRPTIETHRLGPLTLVVGLVLARTVEAEAGIAPRIKWPNDLHVGARKLAGILTELSADMDRVHHVLVGVGINVNAGNEDFSDEIRALATSLRVESGGRRHDRARFLAAFLTAFEPAYDRFVAEGLAPFLPEIEARSLARDRHVRVDVGNQRVEGRARGIGLDGALTVELPGGETVTLHSGEITAVGS